MELYVLNCIPIWNTEQVAGLLLKSSIIACLSNTGGWAKNKSHAPRHHGIHFINGRFSNTRSTVRRNVRQELLLSLSAAIEGNGKNMCELWFLRIRRQNGRIGFYWCAATHICSWIKDNSASFHIFEAYGVKIRSIYSNVCWCVHYVYSQWKVSQWGKARSVKQCMEARQGG